MGWAEILGTGAGIVTVAFVFALIIFSVKKFIKKLFKKSA